MKNEVRIGAVVLASGFSRRMGENKLLLPLNGETVIYETVKSAVSGGFHRVLTVYAQEQVGTQAHRAGGEVLINPDAAEGQSASIRLGTRALSDADGILFLPGDQPFLSVKTLQTMQSLFCESPESILTASYRGVRKSPVLLPKSTFGELMHLTGDTGGREVIAHHTSLLKLVEVNDLKELMDIDTREDYAKIKP